MGIFSEKIICTDEHYNTQIRHYKKGLISASFKKWLFPISRSGNFQKKALISESFKKCQFPEKDV